MHKALCKLVNLAPIDELVFAVLPPLGRTVPLRCIRKHTDPPPSGSDDLILFGHDAAFEGETAGGCAGLVGIPERMLCKHVFISGQTGSGKSQGGLNLMGQFGGRGTPFVVFEPGTNHDYRRLKGLRHHPERRVRRFARNLRIYSPGNEHLPLRFNPLSIPEGISCDQRIENLLVCFKAAFPMEGSMLAILGEALEVLYDRHPDPANPPVMQDLLGAVREVILAKNYAAEVTSNLIAMFDARLGILTHRAVGRVFQCAHSVPEIDELISGQSVIELGDLPPELACLVTLFLLTLIRERIRIVPRGDRALRLVILIEEAHNIVGRSTDAVASAENADPRVHSAALVTRYLAEMRGLGVGLIVLDQHPSAIAPEVVKHTATKLAFRQVDGDDREVLGNCMLLSPVDVVEIARCRPGEAHFHSEGFFRPVRIRTPHVEADWGLPPALSDNELLAGLVNEPWFVQATVSRVQQELGRLQDRTDRVDETRRQFAGRASRLVNQHPRILATVPREQWTDSLAKLRNQARCLAAEIGRVLGAFRRECHRPLLGTEPPPGILDETTLAWRRQLAERFEQGIEPALRSCQDILVRLIEKCYPQTTAKEIKHAN